jgi:hypothetical protein
MPPCQVFRKGPVGHVAVLGVKSPAAITYSLISGAGATASSSNKNVSADS